MLEPTSGPAALPARRRTGVIVRHGRWAALLLIVATVCVVGTALAGLVMILVLAAVGAAIGLAAVAAVFVARADTALRTCARHPTPFP